MRIDRLLSIVTFLLNRGTVTCPRLADEFEVSERTIQRDIEAINLAGIPIVSERGSRGGYRILETFGLSKQTTGAHDLSHIRQAMESLNSALDDKGVSETLEKIRTVSRNDSPGGIRIDFGAARENGELQGKIDQLKQSLEQKRMVTFRYTDAEGRESRKTVDPLTIEYRWYSWYLTAFDRKKKDYRIYKVIRMSDIETTRSPRQIEYDIPENLFDTLSRNDMRETIRIEFNCRKSSLVAVKEYIPGVKAMETDGETYSCTAHVVTGERMWFAFMLSFGDEIEIKSPEMIREKFLNQSLKIMSLYKK
ncbi:MAG: YafY family transcriptional regulator [Spirochaetales bacterium]|nr:YafY family transcriptional regulator [Spirochaetales bacterium]